MRLYRQAPGEARAANHFDGEDALRRQRDRHRASYLLPLREDHTVGGRDATTLFVKINLAGETCGEVIVSGNDFYSSPRLSPDGNRLAWLSGSSNMPGMDRAMGR